VETDFTLFVQG